jgi:hypothetical protein
MEGQNMAKIWIVRERMLWADNPFPYENTTAYTTKKLAMKYMREKWREIKGLYRKEIELEDICDTIRKFQTNNLDCYSIWVEQIEVNK